MSVLTPQLKKRLRRIGHELNPVVMVGNNGVTDELLAETIRALNDHELIKIRISGEDKTSRQTAIDEIVTRLNATNVQQIGKIVLVYKKASEPNPKLSNLVRLSHLADK